LGCSQSKHYWKSQVELQRVEAAVSVDLDPGKVMSFLLKEPIPTLRQDFQV
jgi:hypothetical protein